MDLLNLVDMIYLVNLMNRVIMVNMVNRAAKSAGIGELDSSIAKDLIDSEDPKHTLFCRETAFVAIYALFKG